MSNRAQELGAELEEIKDAVGDVKSDPAYDTKEYRSFHEFVDAYKSGKVDDVDLVTVFHSDNEPGFISLIGEPGVSFETVESMGIDAFKEEIFNIKRQKREASKES